MVAAHAGLVRESGQKELPSTFDAKSRALLPHTSQAGGMVTRPATAECLNGEDAADWHQYLQVLQKRRPVEDVKREWAHGFSGVRELQEDVVRVKDQIHTMMRGFRKEVGIETQPVTGERLASRYQAIDLSCQTQWKYNP
ncbi:uncharacterized protein DSM5745_04979 [Aspergillus mulundensis]|uniref:Uncharacterized protein n=1 Tax=Aspergillus mulundensis TaxID=1810919 RepID=A0A3D8S545_9EURO|nr:hypothetical protein DSM5745_04979 [Aspergillus mulundensis]RDW81422.1 hypothetical protein DSM5745_04979 [Aspergillus mulundensis]